MIKKSDVYAIFDKFYRWAERHSGKRILAIQTDNACEFWKLGHQLAKLGIQHQLSVPYSHQQMGHVEHRHRHIIDTNITMLNHAGLPSSMWDFGIVAASYIYNRNPTSVLNGKSPYEALFKKIPDYGKLRVFGCKAFPCLRAYRANKLDRKSTSCTFLGYSVDNDAYLCLDPESHRMYVSRDVVFDELDFSQNRSLFRDSTGNADPGLGDGLLTDYVLSKTTRIKMS